MGTRRSSRELALKYLYQKEFNDTSEENHWELFFASAAGGEDAEDYAKQLVLTALDKQTAIDDALNQFSEHWTLDRMAVIDRNILRLGSCELQFFKKVPPKAVINEWVEISKKYGNADSPDFVNGMLDKIFKSIQSKMEPTLK
ncbi:MAG: transcription antitermination factor NusB [Candidatus Nitrohelix vancouverensis]|uniref:Transcription antitermination protein NusB n=1 Tax=Candidatus Nitrohelix vancouverensis TaxID=2705534 RepID=A0A7T0C2R9_9BACT|nr:MAG: transcription antitermination factor NusB [Candidatus Nitrohelix vancouverensis]